MRKHIGLVMVVLVTAGMANAATLWTENFDAGAGAWTVVNGTAAVVPAPVAPKGNSFKLPGDAVITRISRAFDPTGHNVLVLSWYFQNNSASLVQRNFCGFMVNATAPAVNNSMVRLGVINPAAEQPEFVVQYFTGTLQTVYTGIKLNNGSLIGSDYTPGWHYAELKLNLTAKTIDWRLDGATGQISHSGLVTPNCVVIGYNYGNGLAGEPAEDVYFDNLVLGTESLTPPPTCALADDQADDVVTNADTVNFTATFTTPLGINETVPPTITIGSLVSNAAMTKVSNLVWSYAWDVPAENNGAYLVTVAAKDTAGTDAILPVGRRVFNIDNPTDTTPPAIVTAVSEKTHDAAVFSVDVMAVGAVEGRRNGPTKLVVTFDEDVVATGALSDVSLSNGTVDSITAAGSTLTVELSGVADRSALTVGFAGIKDAAGNAVADTLCFGVLLGDVASQGSAALDGVVNIYDIIGVKGALDKPVDATNFTKDVTGTGTNPPEGLINIYDIIAIKGNLDKMLSETCP